MKLFLKLCYFPKKKPMNYLIYALRTFVNFFLIIFVRLKRQFRTRDEAIYIFVDLIKRTKSI